MLDDKTRKMLEYSDMILEVIDNAEEFDRGDLQGVIEALVLKIMRESKADRDKDYILVNETINNQ